VDRTKAVALALAAALAVVLAWGGVATAKRRRPAVEAEPKTTGSVTLKLRAIDLRTRHVLVEVGGLSKPPLANFFTFTDERGRHYVSMTIHCDEPFPSGTRVCELEIPAGYERHRLDSLILHLHGLHGRPIAADPSEVRDAWEAAVSLAENPAAAAPDGGADAAP
jgi:hypothetical protein